MFWFVSLTGEPESSSRLRATLLLLLLVWVGLLFFGAWFRFMRTYSGDGL